MTNKTKLTRVNRGSRNEMLASLGVGERFYIECDAGKHIDVMRGYNTPPSRRPTEMDGMEFQASAFTAISCKFGDAPCYLVCVERIK